MVDGAQASDTRVTGSTGTRVSNGVYRYTAWAPCSPYPYPPLRSVHTSLKTAALLQYIEYMDMKGACPGVTYRYLPVQWL